MVDIEDREDENIDGIKDVGDRNRDSEAIRRHCADGKSHDALMNRRLLKNVRAHFERELDYRWLKFNNLPILSLFSSRPA